MSRRTLPVTTALAAIAALLLAGCGSGGDDSSKDRDEIAGSDQGPAKPKKSTDPSAAPAEDKPDGVDLTLPKDMNLVFDWDKPQDKDEAAAMDDTRHFVRSIYRGVGQQSMPDPAVAAYATNKGLSYARTCRRRTDPCKLRGIRFSGSGAMGGVTDKFFNEIAVKTVNGILTKAGIPVIAGERLTAGIKTGGFASALYKIFTGKDGARTGGPGGRRPHRTGSLTHAATAPAKEHDSHG
ncbi:hypothetical protein [Streptomyces sp. NPDC003006]